MAKPNVVLILADDLGYGDLSCFNESSKLHTQRLDQLAAEGMRCTDAHASSALCTPSRYGLMTGRYNWRSQLKAVVLMGMHRHLIEDGRTTLGTLFKGAGYNTACIGKWHLGLDWALEEGADPKLTEIGPPPPGGPAARATEGGEYTPIRYDLPLADGPHTHGFDYSWVTPGSLDIPPYVYVENGMVSQRPDRKTGIPDYWQRAMGPNVEKEVKFSKWPMGDTGANYETMDVVPDTARRVLDKLDEFCADDKPFFLYYPIHAPHVPCVPTPEFAGKSAIGPYGDMVLMVDSIVGRICDKLAEHGKDQDTIVIFTSDNGSEMRFAEEGHISNYIFRGLKSDIWDGGHRIPFIVRWPGHVAPGSVCAQTTCLTDLMATFADVLGVKLADDEGEDSVSNLPLWQEQDAPIREATVHSSGGGMFGIRKGKWKLEMCPDAGRPGPAHAEPGQPPIQLYDMEADPSETTNVWDRHPDVVAELTELLTQYVFSGRSTPGAPQKNTGPERWPQINWLN